MVTEVLNAHAAAIPTLAVVDAAGVDDENGGLKPGDRVTVTGLRSRPELNAKVAVVLAPEVKGERVKVTAFPAPIAVKRSCLSPAPAALDWSFADFLPPGVDPADNSIRGLIRAPGSPLGSIDRCDSSPGGGLAIPRDAGWAPAVSHG